MENPYLQVTPAEAMSRMLSTCFVAPAKSLGDALADFTHRSTSKLKTLYSIKLFIS